MLLLSTIRRHGLQIVIASIVALTFLPSRRSHAQNPRPDQPPPPPPTLNLDQGYIELDSPDLKLKLVKASQTVAALQPKGSAGFDFTPADRLERRAANGYHHLGDLLFRLRVGDSGSWQKFDTADARKPI